MGSTGVGAEDTVLVLAEVTCIVFSGIGVSAGGVDVGAGDIAGDVVVVPKHIRCSVVVVIVDMLRARVFFCRKCAASSVEPWCRI